MFHPVIIMLERAAGIIRRVDKDAFHLTGEVLFEGFEGKEVVAEDEPIIKQVGVRHPVFGVMRFCVIGDEDTRLQPRPVLFPDPSEFEFGFLGGHGD